MSPALRAAVPLSLEAWARARFRRADPAGLPGLEDRLWGGFSVAALRDLGALASAAAPAGAGAAGAGARGTGAAEAAAALTLIARWRGAQGETALALAALDLAAERHPPLARTRAHAHLAALLLCLAGRGPEARARLAAVVPAGARLGPRFGARFSGGFDASRALLRAASWAPDANAEVGALGAGADVDALGAGADEAAALMEINAVFRAHGLQPIGRADPDLPLGLDNLRGVAPGARPGAPEGPLVTVIVPAHRAAATLPAALAGLADQTHAALEVIVVDDASPDATAEVAAEFARADPRFRLIRQTENQGGYAARNRAMAEAKGAFVTIHDADDWSHPEKIARQLAALLRSRAPSTFSAWVRATPGLVFLGAARLQPDLMGFNDSSALIRRDAVERAGPWDTARIGADKELIWRMERLAGRPAEAFRRRMILPDCPLAFGRHAPSSLTRTPASHVLTIYHGLRREYREAAAFWHQGLAPGALPATLPGPPFFPAPPAIRAARADDPGLDLLLVGDLNLQGGTQKSALHMARAARRAGIATGLLHYRRYDQDPTLPLDPAVRRLAGEIGLRIVAPGERLRAATVAITYPPVLAERMDRFPELDHDRLVVVVNQLAERDRQGRDVAYDPAVVRANLREMLGSEGEWAPISPRVRAIMAADPRYPAPSPQTWTPLLDLDAPAPRALWRGPSSGSARPRPVVGRHGRDDPLKWPRDPAAIRAAYCADRPCEVRFLGGDFHARARLGTTPGTTLGGALGGVRPRNWRAIPFGGAEVAAFLADLDVFVHHPDPDYVEEYGRAPMEAMAAGVPVILAPELEPTFGPAALYAPAAGVWPLALRLWQDRAFWEARAAAGRAYVAASCGYDRFAERLA